MKFFLTNLWFLGAVSVVVVAGGFYLSITTENWNWLGGAGSIWTLLALLASSRELTRLGYKKWIAKSGGVDGGGIIPTEEEKEQDRQEKKDKEALAFGVILGILSFPIQIFGYLFQK